MTMQFLLMSELRFLSQSEAERDRARESPGRVLCLRRLHRGRRRLERGTPQHRHTTTDGRKGEDGLFAPCLI